MSTCLPRRHFLCAGASVALGKAISGCARHQPPPENECGMDAIGPPPFLIGGTRAMKEVSYQSPIPPAFYGCELAHEYTRGPCYSSEAEEIRDISYGHDGMPMHLYLRVADVACTVLPGAMVEVWHASPAGLYSGRDAANMQLEFCTGNDEKYAARPYFRGKQIADADGIVFFETCYPGWYHGRTPHVHVAISMGDGVRLTTQLGFREPAAGIYEAHPAYKGRGLPDTTNETDPVLPVSYHTVAPQYLEVSIPKRGGLVASKTLIVRSG